MDKFRFLPNPKSESSTFYRYVMYKNHSVEAIKKEKNKSRIKKLRRILKNDPIIIYDNLGLL